MILTHRNYTANVEQALSRVDIPPHFRTLIILPLDHCFAHVVGFYIMIACGASVATVQIGATPMETLKNIPQNIREVQPHFLLSVPGAGQELPEKHRKLHTGQGADSPRRFSTSRSARHTHTTATGMAGAADGASCWPPSSGFSTRCCSARCGRRSEATSNSSSGAVRCSTRSCSGSSTPSESRCSRDTDFRRRRP